MTSAEELLEGFAPISLEALDDRAALLKRVDRKYTLPWEKFVSLLRRLRDDHQVLEIDGARVFGYSSTYFDTDELRCFLDHVKDRKPRFKARTRLYESSGQCVFEVKLKGSDGETDKRQLDYAPEDRERVTDEAAECVRSALQDAGIDPVDDLRPTLTTGFDRVTLAAAEGEERLTCDLGVTLTGRSGDVAAVRDGLVLVETKSENGQSPSDGVLNEMGIEEISLSKYRVGMSLVGGARDAGTQPGAEHFAAAAAPS